jgi:predicted small secreted protein
MKKIIIPFIFLLFILSACNTTRQGTSGKKVKSKFKLERLYKVWDVERISIGEMSRSGAEMGDPQYEFTNDGQRIKSYKIPPHSESVDYIIRNDSIIFTGNNKLPASAIVSLTDSTLILSNEKAEWKLYIK